jgi:hypothetical protein
MRSQNRHCASRKAGIKKAWAEFRTPSGLDLLDLLKIVSDDGRAAARREQKQMVVEAVGEENYERLYGRRKRNR